MKHLAKISVLFLFLLPISSIVGMDQELIQKLRLQPIVNDCDLKQSELKTEELRLLANLEIEKDSTMYIPSSKLKTYSHLGKYGVQPQDPCFLVSMTYVDEKGEQNLYVPSARGSILLPAKIFHNCNNSSTMNFSFTYKGKNAQKVLYTIEGKCVQTASGEGFKACYDTEMNKFYQNGANNTVDLVSEEEQLELLTDGSIQKTNTTRMGLEEIMPGILAPFSVPSFQHGEKGCSNQNVFEQSIVAERTKGNSVFNFVMNRQYHRNNLSTLHQQDNLKKLQSAERQEQLQKDFKFHKNHKKGDCVLL